MVLDDIISHKRREVAQRKRDNPLDRFRDQLVPGDRSFLEAVTGGSTGFIFEVKKASPSQGVIRPDFDPVRIAAAYAPFADAISVLTDERFFQGGFDVLQSVREAVQQPVLCKDFTLDPYQVYDARLHGASAVLLILSVLDDEGYRACIAAVEELQMDALVEVHTEQELQRAKELGARIVGINNRNLQTLEVDLDATRRLAPQARSFAKAVICESGIRSHGDVLLLRDELEAFLIGTSLMARQDLDSAVREMVFGPVKVCGLTREEDVRAACDAGAVYGGLIFAENSPRRVTAERAQGLIHAAPLRWVGVFVQAPIEKVASLSRDLNLAAVQLHGDEDEDYTRTLRKQLPSECEIWKAFRVDDQLPVLEQEGVDRFLLDGFDPVLRGGTGRSFDWELLNGRDRGRLILSGGLNPANAARADRIGAFLLDVNSGVEQAPGIKDHIRLQRFFRELRGTRNGGVR